MSIQSKRVSPKTIEETYTDNDVPRDKTNAYGVKPYTSYDRSTGFQFDYPMRWLNDNSDFKAVGIRRLKVIPTTHTFDFNLKILLSWYEVTVEPHYIDTEVGEDIDYYDIYYTICDAPRNKLIRDYGNINVHICQKILNENFTHEILTSMVNQINDRFASYGVTPYVYEAKCRVTKNNYDPDAPILSYLNNTYYLVGSGKLTYAQSKSIPDNIRFDYDFDSATGTLRIAPTYTGGDALHGLFTEDTNLLLPRQSNVNELTTQKVYKSYFHITLPSAQLNNINLISFLKFLNQDVNESMLQTITTKQTKWEFTDVWDREVLQVHASFSDNNRGFIGLNDDFYEKPSVLYEPPTNSSNFSVWFTTDGHHRILLRYCRFFVGLCFIRNYNTSLATK